MEAPIPIEVPAAPTGLLRHFVDWLRARFFPDAMEAATARWVAFLILILAAVLVGRFGVRLVFSKIRKISAGAKNPLIVPALEAPASTLVVLTGLVAALSVVPIWDTVPTLVRLGEQGALTAVLLWGMACVGGAVIDHFGEGARARKRQIAAFIPLIKRTAGAFFMVFGVLVVLESLGFEVKTFLTGLGIGGLAFALAAQDTIANLFGSFVVIMDQPFYVGEYIRITGFEGTVEEIGLRSTRLRTVQRTQVVIPNKTVASEAITNFTRMPQRRVEATLGVTYDSPPDAIKRVLEDIRALLRSDPGVHQGVIVASLADFGDTALRVQVVYYAADPDWEAHMGVRERVNLGILRALAARGVSLSYPDPVIRMDPAAARQVGPAG
jgi:MscS family membrane protein